MFSHPDKGEALRNLKILADRLQVGLTEIPNFLEEYGDIAMSMAYFRGVFSELLPRLKAFRAWAEETAESYRFKDDAKFQQKYDSMLELLQEAQETVGGILEGFDKTARSFWQEISMGSFHYMRDMITEQHEVIGGSLCGLYVTTDAWQEQFNGKRASHDKCGEFILAEMIPGLMATKNAVAPVPQPKRTAPPVLSAD
jgi:hypothetical protein